MQHQNCRDLLLQRLSDRGQQFDVPKEMPGGLHLSSQKKEGREIISNLSSLYAFQEQTSDDANVMLNGFSAVVNSLGQRVKPYLPQICGTIKWSLNNKSSKVRQQAADLISRIAVVMKQCGEEQLMGHLGVVLYEYLGEEYHFWDLFLGLSNPLLT
ncbi:RNA splicing factor [Lithospermum erythrorhizon]|uniref:RNA splicing factor n=1 Tax=Lithospermum erythrorhizon TaxID=34254 RepID=A0AAV3PD93_LITER